MFLVSMFLCNVFPFRAGWWLVQELVSMRWAKGKVYSATSLLCPHHISLVFFSLLPLYAYTGVCDNNNNYKNKNKNNNNNNKKSNARVPCSLAAVPHWFHFKNGDLRKSTFRCETRTKKPNANGHHHRPYSVRRDRGHN